MGTGRVLWVIWCLAWAGLWLVLSVLAWTGVAAIWQLATFPILACASAAAVAVPVGSQKRVGPGR